MQRFVDAIAGELEKNRPLLNQVVDHVASRHDKSRDELGTFLEEGIADLEEFEIDLLFSAQFTPTLADQAAFSETIDQEQLDREQWDSLIEALTKRPTVASLETEDGQRHSIQLIDVTIERFVTRLNLDTEIPEPLRDMLDNLPPETDRALLKAIARRPVFRDAGRRELLFRFVLQTTSEDSYCAQDAVDFMDLVEAYKPTDAADMLARIPNWLEILENEVTAASQPKPFFADRVQELHGGGRDQRRSDESLIDRKQRNIDFLKRLQILLADG
jgi:hypothetical protein